MKIHGIVSVLISVKYILKYIHLVMMVIAVETIQFGWNVVKMKLSQPLLQQPQLQQPRLQQQQLQRQQLQQPQLHFRLAPQLLLIQVPNV